MYLSVDIGGTKTLIAVFNPDGTIANEVRFPTAKDFAKFQKDLDEMIDSFSDRYRIDAIAVAAPGLIDYDTNKVISFGNLDWKNVDILSKLKNDFCEKVYIDNDGNMGALGEANMGAGVGYETMLYVTLSTGIGTGVTYNGKLTEVLRKSEGGMMKFMHEGELTTWEKFASGKAFLEEYGLRGKDDNNPEHWKEWAEDVSIGLSEMTAIIQPDIVVLGGSMGVHIDKYHDYLHQSMQKKRGDTVGMPIVTGAKHPERAVVNGCFVTCKQNEN